MFNKVRTKNITTVESGVADQDSIANATVIGDEPPKIVWDGFKFSIFIWVTSA